MKKIGVITEDERFVSALRELGYDAEFIGTDIAALTYKSGNYSMLLISGELQLPIRKNYLEDIFSQSETMLNPRSAEQISDTLAELFLKRGTELVVALSRAGRTETLAKAIDITVHKLFETHEWLDLYFAEESYLSSNFKNTSSQIDMFIGLFEHFTVLYPNHSDVLEELFRYILFAPEGDLRQKSLSDSLHINKSYLSTVFTAQTGMRFVDYVTGVKMLRAAWLLKNTNLKVSEIAGRVEYHDIAYFSKQFKKMFNITPSEYRIPENYEFHI